MAEMSKTPEEIKKGLECCHSYSSSECEECPYSDNGWGETLNCDISLGKDAIALIRQLEVDKAELIKKQSEHADIIRSMMQKNERLARENDDLRLSAIRTNREFAEQQLEILRDIQKKILGETEPVRHGKWIGLEYDGYADGSPVYDLWECSECHMEHEGEEDTLTDYCPHCGAKMDLEEENRK